MSDALLEVLPGSDGFWRWRYTETSEATQGETVLLKSNTVYVTADEAAEAAKKAYPELIVRLSAAGVRQLRTQRRRARRRHRLAVLGVLALVALRLKSR